MDWIVQAALMARKKHVGGGFGSSISSTPRSISPNNVNSDDDDRDSGIYEKSRKKHENQLSVEKLVELRQNLIGPASKLFFAKDPLYVERAFGQYIYDKSGTRNLDCISNVQHVGHCHPAVAEAVALQMTKTNCNCRFLHPGMMECAKEILDTLPAPINKCFFVNSGSEANDLALRMARDFTGGSEVIVLDHAYHGHLSSVMEISPYKFNAVNGIGKPDHVHVIPTPDAYRGKYRLPDGDLENEEKLFEIGQKYADEVGIVIQELKAAGRKLCAFYMEALQSCGGQIITPPGYLQRVIDYVHEAGGVVVVDEVQTGFGRVGDAFWAFQLQGTDVCPDIVTMGKPMGNGFPVSATAAKSEIINTLGKGIEYFNTFGGNPVACAAVLAVLRVIREEGLQMHAAQTGRYLMQKLRALKTSHSCIGDVRGVGLFAGIDLVKDRETREPATELAARVLLELRAKHHVLLSAEGPHSNILKFKPPMCFTEQNVDEMVEKIHAVLTSLDK